MRRFLALLALAFAQPAFAQIAASGAQSDIAQAGSLDLTTVGATFLVPVINGQGVACFDVVGLTGSGATVVTDRLTGMMWTPANMLVSGTGGAFTMALTSDSSYCVTSVAKRSLRVRVTVAGTGSATVSAQLSTNSSLVQFTAPLPPGTNALGTIGVTSLPSLPAGGNVVGYVGLTGQLPAFASTPTVNIGNFPASQPVSGSVTVSNLPATQPVSGSVAVTNLPAAQSVSGSVAVSNFPASQTVAGSVSVANFPATQPVSGSVGVTNFPATQPVSGTVSVSNLPATQAVSGSVGIAGALPAYAATPTFNCGAGCYQVVTSNPTGQVSVATTATLVVAARTGRIKVVLAPKTATTYYIGGSGVTNATGIPVIAGGSITIYGPNAVYAVGDVALTLGYMEYY